MKALRVLLAGMCLASVPAPAWETHTMSPEQIVRHWGESMYCQRMYRHPRNAGRVYPYDVEQCDAASARFEALADTYGPQNARTLKHRANQRAVVIEYDTSDPAMVVRACREQCTALLGQAGPTSKAQAPK